MNYIQYMKPGGNFGDKLKTGIKKFLKAAGEASRMAKDARINNPGAAMIRDAYAKGDEELAKLLTDEMQAANLTGIALGSGAAPLITGFTTAPVTTGATLATGMVGGMAGMYGTDKAINYFSDGKYTGWGNWINQATNGAIGENTAGFFHPGAIFGGLATGKIGNKIVGVTNRGKLELLNSALNNNIQATTLQPTVADEAVLRGQLGWAPKQTIPYRHGSKLADLKTFVPKHDRWDVVTHGADPNMYFVTDLSTPVSAANMMDLRPYQYTGSIVAEKPMVQVGDFNIAGKNATRNQLIARARQQGADTYLLQDIVDNKVPHLNVVARFIGPEGEAVQGGAASVKWYGPTMGKTTAAKTDLLKLVDIDPLLKPIRAKHAERLGLKISDPKVSADPAYKQEVADFVLEWRANPENQGKTLVASTKHLLDPQYKVEFANEPSIPDFETFAARNKARGFKETDEQLRAWYNSILELGRDLNIDNRFVLDVEGLAPASSVIDNNGIAYALIDEYVPVLNVGPSAVDRSKAFIKAVSDGKAVASHPAIIDLLVHNNKLAARIYGSSQGKNSYNIPDGIQYKTVPHDELVKRQQGASNALGGDWEHVGGLWDPINKDLVVATRGNMMDPVIPYHEALHAIRYGVTADPRLTQLKISKIIDPIKAQTTKGGNYYFSNIEAPVHYLSLGKLWGIPIGAPYPGRAAVEELIFKNGIGGTPWFTKLLTDRDYKRFWDAITGMYFKSGGKLNYLNLFK